MKKIFILLIVLFACQRSYCQIKMQATMKPGSTPGTIDIYVKPSASFSQKDEAMTFALAIPATVLPAPSIGTSGATANGTGLVPGIVGLQPNIMVNNFAATLREVVVTNETINSNAFYIYTFIFAGTASLPHNWVAEVEQQLFTVGFNGCTSNCNTGSIKMVSLANGGSSHSTYWYFQPNTLGDITNYAAPFYANPFSGAIINGGSADGSSLSWIELSTAVVLPVKFGLFDASVNQCNVTLNWQTISEANTDYFAIERGDNDRSFIEIGKIKAAHYSSNIQSYRFTDKGATGGKLFYRLRIVDKDSKISFSPVITVSSNCNGKNAISIYPTLTAGLVNVKLPVGLESSHVKVVNAIGKVVATDESRTLIRTIDLKRLSDGAYVVQVISDDKIVYNMKVVVQH